MNIRNLRIATRSLISFGLIALLMLGLGLFSLDQITTMRQAVVHTEDVSHAGTRYIARIRDNQLGIRVITLRMMLNRDPATLGPTVERLGFLRGELDKAMQGYREIASEPARPAFRQMETVVAAYNQQLDSYQALSEKNDTDGMLALLNGAIQESSNKTGDLFNELVKVNADQAARYTEEAKASYAFAVRTTVAVLVVAFALTLLLAWLLTRSITRPLLEGIAVAQAIAAGKLSGKIVITGNDESTRLLEALAMMKHSLIDTLRLIGDSSHQLAAASEQMTAITNQTARDLSQQHDEVQQAATAVTEMTTAVEEVARNAVSTADASKDSTTTAQRGRERVDTTLGSIKRMNDSVGSASVQVSELAERSQEIGKVLDVIRGIAEQTNLLALNAAIEAARAGEAGRGFAVVADEVRALAGRTQTSTQEIEQMVGAIQAGTSQVVSTMSENSRQVLATLDEAQVAGDALDEIIEAINQIHERNLVIASASEEQAQVSREIDRNLVNIRDLSVQTSEGASQIDAASQSLSHLSHELKAMVGRFEL
ncbi:methyl-accepting chemotaxis protein [Phytopseudomonas dryadis]|uniref:Methyl-accepting chemotaxis protein n=1 Tax=Phytopseudomonas dryadis TaxID=2487520 RepID=A0A4Q9QST2_9GAMM|nr:MULTISPECIES: methyl-accepting chemotaxis protein [Pseudomonas]TBU84832.1 methyl-accepting chemotaxis protein [Pseudomonas dryadis]TBV01254.1 methyl-accepting chemotaxis protein [Pseudomonas dryadis]TBV14708.1 methyl-accepting chemotaxis protein [Pseudomonas sp. FRB 230]